MAKQNVLEKYAHALDERGLYAAINAKKLPDGSRGSIMMTLKGDDLCICDLTFGPENDLLYQLPINKLENFKVKGIPFFDLSFTVDDEKFDFEYAGILDRQTTKIIKVIQEKLK